MYEKFGRESQKICSLSHLCFGFLEDHFHIWQGVHNLCILSILGLILQFDLVKKVDYPVVALLTSAGFFPGENLEHSWLHNKIFGMKEDVIETKVVQSMLMIFQALQLDVSWFFSVFVSFLIVPNILLTSVKVSSVWYCPIELLHRIILI